MLVGEEKLETWEARPDLCSVFVWGGSVKDSRFADLLALLCWLVTLNGGAWWGHLGSFSPYFSGYFPYFSFRFHSLRQREVGPSIFFRLLPARASLSPPPSLFHVPHFESPQLGCCRRRQQKTRGQRHQRPACLTHPPSQVPGGWVVLSRRIAAGTKAESSAVDELLGGSCD